MRKIQKTAIVGGAVATLMAGGVAFAAWTSTGTGTGTVTAGHEQGLSVSQVGTVSGLYPTGNQLIDVKVHNNNPYQVTIDNLEITGVTVANGGIGLEACDSSDVDAVIVTPDPSTGVDVAATSDSTTILGVAKVTMHADAANLCQGADFKVALKATAHSS